MTYSRRYYHIYRTTTIVNQLLPTVVAIGVVPIIIVRQLQQSCPRKALHGFGCIPLVLLLARLFSRVYNWDRRPEELRRRIGGIGDIGNIVETAFGLLMSRVRAPIGIITTDTTRTARVFTYHKTDQTIRRQYRSNNNNILEISSDFGITKSNIIMMIPGQYAG